MLRPPFSPIVLLTCLAPSLLYAWDSADTERLCRKMDDAYSRVNDYQAGVEIRTFGRDQAFATRRFRYSFKKPKWIRIDFESPDSGVILVYPDDRGKAVLRRFFTFRLDPDSFLLRDPSGQTVDKTDLGSLIRNIRRSLTDPFRGAVDVSEMENFIHLRLLAGDHFQAGVLTRYGFVIDKRVWLPARVEESTPEGPLKRTIEFRDLKTNLGIPESYFRLNGD